MDDLADLKKEAETHRRSAGDLSEEAERLMSEHAALVKKAKNLSSKAANSARMRDECAREAANSEGKTEAWRSRLEDRKGRDALDLSNERNQMHMHSQAAKGMRVRERRAESERIKLEKEAEECKKRAYELKNRANSLHRNANSEYELYQGLTRKISKIEKKDDSGA
jgi:chromosome segregation ATPase